MGAPLGPQPMTFNRNGWRFSVIALASLVGCGQDPSFAPQSNTTKIGVAASQVDTQVLNVSPVIEYNVLNHPSPSTLQALVSALVGSGFSTERTAKVLHDWISLHVLYNTNSWNAGYYPSTDPYQVLATGLAECCGYTTLFYTMAQMAGLQVSGVTGAVANDHIWNAVMDNGQWMMIDVTWDSGASPGGYSYSTSYFYLTADQISTAIDHAYGSGGVFTYNQTFDSEAGGYCTFSAAGKPHE